MRDYGVAEFKKNVLALAATAKLYGMPTILTTSLEGARPAVQPVPSLPLGTPFESVPAA